MRKLSFSACRTLFAIALGALAAGCAVTPSSIVVAPTTSRPGLATPSTPQNGSIFQASTYRPLFEDRRARLVGDLITVNIVEKTNAGKQGSNSASKTGSVSAGVPTIFGRQIAGAEVSTKAASKFEEKDALSSGNNFATTLTATVVEVLPNGNMVIAGEKQVALDSGTEFIRFSGTVSPVSIGPGNVVASTQIADVRAEYRTNTRVDSAAVLGYLTRFFMSVLPL